MRRALSVTAAFLSCLASGALGLPAGAAARSPAKPKAAAPGRVPTPRPIVVKSVEPKDVVAGDEVTVTGSGFDQGTVLLLGTESPKAIEQSDKRIVFRIPEEGSPAAWSAPLYLITPGQRVVNTNATLQVMPKASRSAPRAAVPPALEVYALQTVAAVSKAAEKSWPIDLEGVDAIRVSVEAASGECEVRVEPEGGTTTIRATQGGLLKLELTSRSLRAAGGKQATRAALVVANDAVKPVAVRVSVQRVESKEIRRNRAVVP